MAIQSGNIKLPSTPADPLLGLETAPSLDLQFSASKTLDDQVSGQNLITFSRSTTGTYVDSSGVIQTAAIDAPRFDHDPTTGESLGLLVEESRTNLIPSSNDFGSFFASNVSKSAGFVGPDDSQDAYKITSTTSSLRSRIFTFLNSTAGTVVTFSVYLKIDSGSLSQQASIAIGSQANYASKNITLTTEWQRFEITGTVPSDGVESANPLVYLNPNADSGIAVAGDYLYIWGAQVEVGSFPTSYIPTSGSTVTRSADVAEITGTNFSSWYNQSEGTVLSRYIPMYPNTAGGQYLLEIGSDSNNRWALVVRQDLSFSGYVSVAGAAVLDISKNNAFVENTEYSSALAVSSNNGALFYDGSQQGTTDSSVSLPASDYLTIGSRPGGAGIISAHIKRLTYYPYRLADGTLQTITL